MSRLTQTISALSLAAGLNACGQPTAHENPSRPNIQDTQETIEAHVRRVCAEQGFGKHETALAEFECFDPSGIYVSDPPMKIDLRDPKELTFADIPEQIKNKKAAIFGERHDKGYDDKIFIESMPALKAEGFTHVAIEIPFEYQSDIDAYFRDGNIEHLKLIKPFKDIIRSAKENGLLIACIDDRKKFTKKHERFFNKLLINFDELQPDEKSEAKKVHIDYFSNREDIIFGRIERLLADENVRLAIFYGFMHGLTKKDVDVQFVGSSLTSSTIGHRLKKKYGEKFASIDLSGCDIPEIIDENDLYQFERFSQFKKYAIDACMDSENEVARLKSL